MPIKMAALEEEKIPTNKLIPIHGLPLPASLGVHLENLVFFNYHVKMMII